uniref:Uncharacterized protein n=1 Tax=Aegilops tauschii TaxID=37682 RepID=M8CAG9_AEGTA
MEKATKNKQVASAIGEPITRGPWYSASIAVNRARRSVSCTFPVSGPQGDGLLKFKAVRLGDQRCSGLDLRPKYQVALFRWERLQWNLAGQPDSYLSRIICFHAEESWFRFLQRSDWEILIMDAILDVRAEDGKRQTMRVTVADNTAAPPPPADCRTCKPRATPKPKPTAVPTPLPTSAPPPAQEK